MAIQKEKKTHHLVRGLRWLVGIAIIAYLFYVVEPSKMIKALGNADLSFVPAWIALSLLCQALGTLKIYLLLVPIAPVPYLTLLRYDIVATSIGYFTPGQIGAPVSLAVSLKEQSVEVSQSASVLLLDKIITLAVTISLGAFGIYEALKGQPGSVGPPVTLLGNAMLTLPPLVLVFLGFQSMRWQQGWVKIKMNAEPFVKGLRKQLKLEYLLLNAGVTILAQAVTALTWMLALHAIGRSVPYLSMLISGPAISIIGYIPVSISGLGTQELGAVALWRHLGVLPIEVLSAFACVRVLVYAMGAVLMLVGIVINRRLRRVE